MSKKNKAAVYVQHDDTYRGYTTNDVFEACQEYYSHVGEVPTVVIARPECELSNENELVIRSFLGAGGVLLVSHYISPKEVEKHKHCLPQRHARPFEEARVTVHRDTPLERPSKTWSFENTHKDDCNCPHCGHEITDFENLGYWYGWRLGQYPPYWDELREYVFRRDNYTCSKCGVRLGSKNLTCHHIHPKEEFGVDGARNLVTMCGVCHPDTHPIFPDPDGEIHPGGSPPDFFE